MSEDLRFEHEVVFSLLELPDGDDYHLSTEIEGLECPAERILKNIYRSLRQRGAKVGTKYKMTIKLDPIGP